MSSRPTTLVLIPGSHIVAGEMGGNGHLVRESAGFVLWDDKGLDLWERQ